MQIKSSHSHLNGEECMLVHYRDLWTDVRAVIGSVDAEACRARDFIEKDGQGKRLISPEEINRRLRDGFEGRGWQQRKAAFWVTRDENPLRSVNGVSENERNHETGETGHETIRPYNRTGFVKGRVAVELQFDDYAFTTQELFAGHLSSYVSEIIDVGIGILPVEELEREMSCGVPCYERDLPDVFRQGRGVPPVPLVFIGIAP